MEKTKILFVIDMQNDFIDGALGTAEACAILPKVVERIEGWDGDVIYTMDTHFADYAETQEGRRLPVPHCIKGTPGWELAPPIARQAAGAPCVEKLTFGSSQLPALLQATYGDRLANAEFELVGLCTDICVISNAMVLKAFFPEAEIKVNAACCAGVTPESHQNALAAMATCQIEII